MFGIGLCQKTSTPCEPKRTPSGLETDVLTGGFATLLFSGSLETDVLTGGFATLLFFVFCPGSAVPSLTGGFATLLLSVRLESISDVSSLASPQAREGSMQDSPQGQEVLGSQEDSECRIGHRNPGRHVGHVGTPPDSFPSPLPCFVLPCFALRFLCIALLCVSFALRCFAVFCIWIAMFSRALLCVSFALLCFAFPLLCVALLCLALPCSALRCCDFLCSAFRGAHRSGTEVSQRCAAWARLTFHWVPSFS